MLSTNTFHQQLAAVGMQCVCGSLDHVTATLNSYPEARTVMLDASDPDLDGRMVDILRLSPEVVGIVG